MKDIGTDRILVQTYMQVQLSVSGKGSSYVKFFEVDPDESMDVIRTRAPFYRLFTQRRYSLYRLKGAKGDQVEGDAFDDASLFAITWRESGAASGGRFVLKEPSRDRAPRPNMDR